MRTRMHQEAFPGEDISDRPPPEESVPGLLALIDGRPAERPLPRARARRRGRCVSALAFELPPRSRRASRPRRAGWLATSVRLLVARARATARSSTRVPRPAGAARARRPARGQHLGDAARGRRRARATASRVRVHFSTRAPAARPTRGGSSSCGSADGARPATTAAPASGSRSPAALSSSSSRRTRRARG